MKIFVGLMIGVACMNGIVFAEESIDFDGFNVVRAFAKASEQGDALIALQKTNEWNLDFWTEPKLQDGTDIMVGHKHLSKLLAYLNGYSFNYEILIKDVGKIIRDQKNSSPKQGTLETMSWTKYHNLDTINEWLQNLTETYSFVEIISIGSSTEGRDLKVLKLSTNSSQNKPAIFIDATIHAREWISLATITYIINELVSNPDDFALLQDVDFYFLPVINPDGYEFTHTTNRMWRKTRSLNPPACVGVDANRNFGFSWNSCVGCSSGLCSSETFRGNQPFSEPEADAMRVFIENSSKDGVNFQAYISIHSYGQYFMIPWGFTAEPPSDLDELMEISRNVKSNISSLYGTDFEIGPSSTTIYFTDGTSQDWAYGAGIFKYVFTAELRDTGSYGFLLPAEQIIPTAQETWKGFKVVVDHIKGK